jgi:hypothetical protein
MTVYVAAAHAHVQRLFFINQNGDRAWRVYYIREEFCCVFLWAKRLTAKDIHKEMFSIYGGKCLSRKAVHNLVEKFSQGRSKVVDDARSVRPVVITTEATVQRVEELIRTGRRKTIDKVATAIGCSHGFEYSIMHDRLKFRKVWAWWVPIMGTSLPTRIKACFNAMETEARNWLRQQSKDSVGGFDPPIKRWDKFNQCRWTICREINVSSRLEYHTFYVLCSFVNYLLTLPRRLVCQLPLTSAFRHIHTLSIEIWDS